MIWYLKIGMTLLKRERKKNYWSKFRIWIILTTHCGGRKVTTDGWRRKMKNCNRKSIDRSLLISSLFAMLFQRATSMDSGFFSFFLQMCKVLFPNNIFWSNGFVSFFSYPDYGLSKTNKQKKNEFFLRKVSTHSA